MDVVCTSGISNDKLSFSISSVLTLGDVLDEEAEVSSFFGVLFLTFSEDLYRKVIKVARKNSVSG